MRKNETLILYRLQIKFYGFESVWRQFQRRTRSHTTYVYFSCLLLFLLRWLLPDNACASVHDGAHSGHVTSLPQHNLSGTSLYAAFLLWLLLHCRFAAREHVGASLHDRRWHRRRGGSGGFRCVYQFSLCFLNALCWHDHFDFLWGIFLHIASSNDGSHQKHRACAQQPYSLLVDADVADCGHGLFVCAAF